MPITELSFNGKITRVKSLNVNDVVNDSIIIPGVDQQYTLIEIATDNNKITAEICGNVPQTALNLQVRLTELYVKSKTSEKVYHTVHQTLIFPGEYDKVLIDKTIKT